MRSQGRRDSSPPLHDCSGTDIGCAGWRRLAGGACRSGFAVNAVTGIAVSSKESCSGVGNRMGVSMLPLIPRSCALRYNYIKLRWVGLRAGLVARGGARGWD